MKTKFYCVNVEFYDSGIVKSCLTTSNTKGRSHYRQVPGMTAFKMWWNIESYASQIIENVKDGSIGVDDFFAVWSDFVDFENKVSIKRAAA